MVTLYCTYLVGRERNWEVINMEQIYHIYNNVFKMKKGEGNFYLRSVNIRVPTRKRKMQF